jgi:hypothetical protein
MPLWCSPLVLPDSSPVLKIHRAQWGGVLLALETDGRPRWRLALQETWEPTVTAEGDLVLRCVGAEQALWCVALTGENVRTADLPKDPLWHPAWASEPPPGPSPKTAVVGSAHALGRAYQLLTASRSAHSPRAGPRVEAFAATGERLWTCPLPVDADTWAADGRFPRQPHGRIVCGRRRVVAVVDARAITLDADSGAILSDDSLSVPYLALDSNDEPIPLARFGPPLASPPVVDAKDRRYAGTRRGTVVGLDADGSPLFEVPVAPPASSNVVGGADGRLALAPGRLYLVQGDELLCIGNE